MRVMAHVEPYPPSPPLGSSLYDAPFMSKVRKTGRGDRGTPVCGGPSIGASLSSPTTDRPKSMGDRTLRGKGGSAFAKLLTNPGPYPPREEAWITGWDLRSPIIPGKGDGGSGVSSLSSTARKGVHKYRTRLWRRGELVVMQMIRSQLTPINARVGHLLGF